MRPLTCTSKTSTGTKKRKKVIVIRKTKHRDGSVEVRKHHLHGLSVSEAINEINCDPDYLKKLF